MPINIYWSKCFSGHLKCSSDNCVGKLSPKSRTLFLETPKKTNDLVLFSEKFYYSKQSTGHLGYKVFKPGENFSPKLKIRSSSKKLELMTLCFEHLFFRKYSIWHIEGSFDNASERVSAMFKKKNPSKTKKLQLIYLFPSQHVISMSSSAPVECSFDNPCGKVLYEFRNFFTQRAKPIAKIIYFQEGTILLKMALRTCRMQGCKPDGKNPQGPKRSNSQKIKEIFFCKIS